MSNIYYNFSPLSIPNLPGAKIDFMSELPVPAGAVGGELDVRIIGIDVGFAELDFFGILYLYGDAVSLHS